jgi:alpha-L-arabinofuranosidase
VTLSGELRQLDIAATLNKTKDKLTVSVINPTQNEIKLPMELLNGKITGAGELWQVTAPDDMAYNEPGQPEKVKIEGPVSISSSQSLMIKPASINIFYSL